MWEKIKNYATSIIWKPDGSVNIRNIIGIGAGAAIGVLGGMEFAVGANAPLLGAVAGAAAGLGGATLVGMVAPGEPTILNGLVPPVAGMPQQPPVQGQVQTPQQGFVPNIQQVTNLMQGGQSRK